jgi:tRNA G10  N-methylase Trm11
MSKTFIFQTGHGKGLAKAEILSLFPNSIIDEVDDGFVVQTAEIEIDPEKPWAVKSIQDRMGGIVRITEVIQSGPANMPLNFEEWVICAIAELASREENKDRKIRFGLSMHPKSEKILKKILIGTKKNVQKSKTGKALINLRFVNKDFQNLSSVQAWHQKLLKNNSVELHLFRSNDDLEKPKWYLTRTLSIQDFEAYSHRDYDRPARSAKNGMFPPKLAQILINLALSKDESDENQTNANVDVDYIFDPFCGSGTVMQEASLMGLMSWGSDLSEQMVEDSKKNLDWLKTEYSKKHILEMGKLPHIFQADATKLTAEQIPSPSHFTIVTETWLGPILEKPLTDLERPKVQREIEALYEAFFSNLKKILAGTEITPVTMVFTAPYHRSGKDRHFLPNLPKILAEYTEIIPLSDHERPSLFFERKNQLVSREIWKVRIHP